MSHWNPWGKTQQSDRRWQSGAIPAGHRAQAASRSCDLGPNPPWAVIKPPRNRWDRHAFTLVEMLVVVAIVAILVALMFPALNAAREASRSTTCQNNLRQFHHGLMTHAQTHGLFCSGAKIGRAHV